MRTLLTIVGALVLWAVLSVLLGWAWSRIPRPDAPQVPDHLSILSPPPSMRSESAWETCAACGREYLYPHLCRKHRLCGLCHPAVTRPVPDTAPIPRPIPRTGEPE